MKAVVGILAALCLAQVLMPIHAAPMEEEAFGLRVKGNNIFACIKEVTQALGVVKEIRQLYTDFKKISADSKAAITACQAETDKKAMEDCVAESKAEHDKAIQVEVNKAADLVPKIYEHVVALSQCLN